MNAEQRLFEENREALIELIVFYRDFYHREDFCHTEMIEKINGCETTEELEVYWQTVDGWM